ncbi:TPA: sel1 repeat family protein [Campylobacter lari]|nr:sel1 repeat family protein [Campylobacter lari]HEC1764770.1 sel1 repeat family protein [Campylobacter lari]
MKKVLIILAILFLNFAYSQEDMLEKDCIENKKGCYFLGAIYRLHYKNYPKAAEFYKRACELNDGDGCWELAFLYETGKGVKMSSSMAEKLYNKACSLNSFHACFDLGVIYEKGQVVSKNNFKAVEFYKKACDMNYKEGCNSLGFMYENGRGIRKDTSKALEYFGKACDLKDDLGCQNYARLKQ